MEDVSKYLSSLEGLSGLALVGLSCLVLGYVLKLIPKFPNASIPVVIILWAMVLTPLIDEGKAAGEVTRIWLIRHILFGLVVGAAAWLLHNQVLKRIEDKIPILGGMLKNASAATDAITEVKPPDEKKP